MPALIGYFLTLVVFLGGGYAGLHWLTTSDNRPSVVAVHSSAQPGKSTRARLLARKRHEAAAEREANAGPLDNTAPPAPDEMSPSIVETRSMAADTKTPSVSEHLQPGESQQSSTAAAALVENRHAVSLSPIIHQSSLPPTDKLGPAEPPSTAKAVATSTRPDMLGSRSNADRNLVPEPHQFVTAEGGEKAVKKRAARPILEQANAEAVDGRRASVTKRRAPTRLSSRKPVMMILRTIEFADGRREQRLLPMPRYRQAFADDWD